MAIKLLDDVYLTSIPQLSVRHNLEETVIDHCIEVYLTDANTSITVFTIDLQTRCNKAEPFITVREHTFTSDQLTALTAKINILDEPATEVRVNISVATNAGAGDTAKVWYHPVLITK